MLRLVTDHKALRSSLIVTNETVLSRKEGRNDELILSFHSLRSESVSMASSFLQSMLTGRGFVLESHHVVRRQVIHKDHLDYAMSKFNEVLAEGGQSELCPLPEETIQRLTRIVKIHVFEFSGKHGESATIKHCERNWYPAIFIDLWTRKKPRFPAGFLTLRGLTCASCDEIRQELVSRRNS